MSSLYKQLTADLLAQKNDKQAIILSRFFKTGKGQYGHGDIFWGIKVPIQRAIAKKYYKEITLSELQKLIISKFHECRLTALLILTYKYPKSTPTEQKKIVAFYIKNMSNINNWDLVDLTAPNILGASLQKKSHRCLFNLAKSKNVWYRRIAIMSTFIFIKNGNFTDTIKMAKLYLSDKHDLIHKATGWMLREIGKRDIAVLEYFLNDYSDKMPRTMLRYAIEKLPDNLRKSYLQKK